MQRAALDKLNQKRKWYQQQLEAERMMARSMSKAKQVWCWWIMFVRATAMPDQLAGWFARRKELLWLPGPAVRLFVYVKRLTGQHTLGKRRPLVIGGKALRLASSYWWRVMACFMQGSPQSPSAGDDPSLCNLRSHWMPMACLCAR